ncbi:unnamed protein product [Adineta steineri]|uniref:Uncharacterized protein n=1 Tax=Adineta steineri TaxID=433720 RepID=A0A820C4U9_9BILA|nr:unnamed protein product [Adineta steineri]
MSVLLSSSTGCSCVPTLYIDSFPQRVSQKVVQVNSNHFNEHKHQVKSSQAKSLENKFSIQIPLYNGVLKLKSSQVKNSANNVNVKSSHASGASDAVQVNNEWALI